MYFSNAICSCYYVCNTVNATQRHTGFSKNENSVTNAEHDISNRVLGALGTVLVTMCIKCLFS